MKVAIVKYNAGNIYSVDCALRRVGVEAEITDNISGSRRGGVNDALFEKK